MNRPIRDLDTKVNLIGVYPFIFFNINASVFPFLTLIAVGD